MPGRSDHGFCAVGSLSIGNESGMFLGIALADLGRLDLLPGRRACALFPALSVILATFV